MADVEIRVRLDQDTKDKLKAMLPEAFARAIGKAEARIKAYWRDIAPVGQGWKHAKYGPSGRLRDEFMVTTTPNTIQMFWTAPYAKIVDEGATPHVIKGNPLLRFFWASRGLWMSTHSVDHPGYAGKRFSDHMRIVAPQFLREAIIEELQGLRIP